MSRLDEQSRIVERLEQIVASLESHLEIAEAYGTPDFASSVSLESSRHDYSEAKARLESAQSVLNVLQQHDDVHIFLSSERNPHGPIPIDSLGRFLHHLQSLTNAVQQSIVGQATSRGRVQNQVRHDACLYAYGSMVGSYGVRLRTSEPEHTELATHRESNDLSSMMADFLDATNFDHTRIVEMCRHSPRTFSTYRELLSVLSKSRISVRVAAASKTFATYMTSDQASQREIDLLSLEVTERELELVGQLVGASMLRDSFELSVGNDTYKGRVRQGLAQRIAESDLYGKLVDATILETVEQQSDGLAEPVTRYELIAVTARDDRQGRLYET